MNNQLIDLKNDSINKLKKFANIATSDTDLDYIQEELNWFYTNNLVSPVIKEIEMIIYWKSIFCKN